MRPDPLPATFPAQPTPAPAAAAAVGRLPTFHIVGFSGHRRLTDAAGAGVAIRGALEALQRQIPGEWIALSSIATGGDRVFVQQARAMGLSWHAILPLPRAEFEKDFTPTEWREVEATLEQADHLRIIGDSGDREEAYLDCAGPGCELACTEATRCGFSCGDDCDVACTGAGDCEFTTGEDSTVACTGPGLCDLDVGRGSVVECTGAGDCDIYCNGSCTVRCLGGGLCDVLCPPGASCEVSGTPTR